MGYEDAYRALLDTLQQATELSGSIAGRVADDVMVDESILFARMVIQAHSLKKILPDVDRPVQGLDISSCASITRNLVETFLVLHDRWLEEVAPNVRRFRDLFWSYHQKKEEIRGLNLLREFHGEKPHDEDIYIREAKCALEADPEFRRLEDKRRAHLLNKREPCARGQQAIAVSAGIAAAKFGSDYKLLSSLSHPNGFGVRAMDVTTLADDGWQTWFAQITWIAQTYLELAVSGVRMCMSQADCS